MSSQGRKLRYMSQFKMLDCYRNRRSVETQYGDVTIEKVVRLSEYEYQLMLREVHSEHAQCYYLKLRTEKHNAVNVLHRWDESYNC